MLIKLVILWPVIVFSFISASQTVLICLILLQWLLQIWVRNHVCLHDPHVSMTNWEYVRFHSCIYCSWNWLYSFLNRHGSLFKMRLLACLGVFIPIPQTTAFFRHVSVCPLDILISFWRIPYGIWRLKAECPVGHVFSHPSPGGMGWWRRLSTSHSNTTGIHVSHGLSQALLQSAPWVELSLRISCSCAVEF